MRTIKNSLQKIAVVFAVLFLVSCSSDEADSVQSKQFRYIDLEKNVLIPAVNSRDIVFYALDFDTNFNVWQLTLTDGEKDIPVTFNKIEDTLYGWQSYENPMQKIYCKVPAFGVGNYTLTVKNTITGQTQQILFIVRDQTFNKTQPEEKSAYYSLEEVNNYLSFQNTTNVINSTVSKTGIKKIVLENINTFSQTELNYNTDNEFIKYVIPQSLPTGVYYLAINYNSGINSYFERRVIILNEQKPVVNSINKTELVSGDELILKGKNFRYKINEENIPTKGLGYVPTETQLVFMKGSSTEVYSLGRWQDDKRYNYINADFTELKLPIPKKEDWYIFSDSERTYYEGEVYLKNGPYRSESFTLRIDFN